MLTEDQFNDKFRFLGNWFDKAITNFMERINRFIGTITHQRLQNLKITLKNYNSTLCNNKSPYELYIQYPDQFLDILDTLNINRFTYIL